MNVGSFDAYTGYGHTLQQVVIPVFHYMRTATQPRHCAHLCGFDPAKVQPGNTFFHRAKGYVWNSALDHIPRLQLAAACPQQSVQPERPGGPLDCDGMMWTKLQVGWTQQQACKDSAALMRRTVLGDDGPARSKTVLWWNRQHAVHRTTQNQQEMLAALSAVVSEHPGWQLLNINADANHSALEQARFWADAKVAITPHGAGMANLNFLRPQSVALLDCCGADYHTRFAPADIEIVQNCRDVMGMGIGRNIYTGALDPSPRTRDGHDQHAVADDVRMDACGLAYKLEAILWKISGKEPLRRMAPCTNGRPKQFLGIHPEPSPWIKEALGLQEQTAPREQLPMPKFSTRAAPQHRS